MVPMEHSQGVAKFGVPLGRVASEQGRPMVWSPKPELLRLIAPRET